MNNCPLCDEKAVIELPEWSGGRYLIDCANCGSFSSNRIAIKEMKALRAAGSCRINELQASIISADHLWYITKHPGIGQLVLESGPPRTMGKREKKLRRRGKTVLAGPIYTIQPTAKPDDS